MKYSIRIDILPGYGYSSNALYRDADTTAQLNKIIASYKKVPGAYRISVNGKEKYASRGSGAKKRWFKSK